MATSTRRRPSPARRRTPAAAARRPGAPYRQTRAAIALALFLLFFSALWVVNGDFTAQWVMSATGADAAIGWSVHILLSAIEVAPAFLAPYLRQLPRRLIVILWLVSLPFGVFDVYTSAIGVARYLAWSPATGLWIHVQNTIAAEIIGFTPEPMIVFLFIALITVLRGNE